MKVIAGIVLVAAVVAGLYFFNQNFEPERRTEAEMAAASAAEQDLAKADELEASLASDEQQQPTSEAQEPEADADPGGGDTVNVKFETTKGDFVVELHRDWSPLGVQQVIDAVNDGVYNDIRLFRVVPGFVVQFGIPSNPAKAALWDTKTIPDERPKESNTEGMVTFAMAGPNSRTTQLFINYGDNSRLDSMGFAPIGKVIEGMDVVRSFESKYADQPTSYQGEITAQGNAFLDERFPDLDSIKKATVLDKE